MIPKYAYVYNVKIPVKLVKKATKRGGNIIGEFSRSPHIKLLNKKMISKICKIKSQKKIDYEFLETYIHELIHACFYFTGMNQLDSEYSVSYQLEEFICYTLPASLLREYTFEYLKKPEKTTDSKQNTRVYYLVYNSIKDYFFNTYNFCDYSIYKDMNEFSANRLILSQHNYFSNYIRHVLFQNFKIKEKK